MAHAIRRPVVQRGSTFDVRGRRLHAALTRTRVENRRLRAVAEAGDSPLAIVIVVAQVVAVLAVIVVIELAVTLSFYFGWL
jgi:hypothetical protein